MCALVGVSALLVSQPSGAGTGNHSQPDDQTDHRTAEVRSYDEYVAIGDSYTTGAGIPPVDGSACARSKRSYPRRLAAKIGAELHDASCGGATTAHVENGQPNGSLTNAPQISAVDRHTDLVTISLGVNDNAAYATLLTHCRQVAATDPNGSPCRDAFRTPTGGDAFLEGLPDVQARIEGVVRAVRHRGPHAEIAVIGYPQPVPATGTCAALPFARGDYAYLAAFFKRLDHTIKAAARRTQVTYVDLLPASRGHDICAGDEAWILGKHSNGRALAFHPFAKEQRAVATLVAHALAAPADADD